MNAITRSPLRSAFAAAVSLAAVLAASAVPATPAGPQADVKPNEVRLDVAVTDKAGRAAKGLTRDSFVVYDNGARQTITSFATEEGPTSWGIVVDRSKYVRAWMTKDVSDASLHMLGMGTPRDEFFVMTFAGEPTLASDFTADRSGLEKAIVGREAGGESAFYDAVSAAIDQARRGAHAKKVLVVVTAGEDTASRISFNELVAKAEGSGVLIYTVGVFENRLPKERVVRGGHVEGELERLAEVTGGSAHWTRDMRECHRKMMQIGAEVSRHYTLVYTPSDAGRDGRWRKVRVEVEGPTAKGLVVRTRSGYRAGSSR